MSDKSSAGTLLFLLEIEFEVPKEIVVWGKLDRSLQAFSIVVNSFEVRHCVLFIFLFLVPSTCLAHGRHIVNVDLNFSKLSLESKDLFLLF